MLIHDIFEKDIDRNINGVVQVADDAAIRQELEEYVVTRELRRHFADFYEAYEKALDAPTDRVGVWVSGYFGSGKSHFLKMLSYLLQNPEVEGRRAIEYFEGKITDPMVAAQMRRASEVETESVLFNMDAKGGGWKEGETAKTALLRTFARVFYDHRGFYGTDYKLARFERMVDDRGGTQRFREAYERIARASWLEDRDAYEFHSDDIAEAAHEALGLSAADVERWVDSDAQVTLSPDDLVHDIKAYVERRKAECGGRFRLLFLADEVGQFIGNSGDLMLNLQTIVERLGSECRGDAWVMVTSQEALDEMHEIVNFEFSKIQGRFATRLSLSSTSVDEVIQRRVLWKDDASAAQLRQAYQQKSAVLKNLFTFEEAVGDLVGYGSEADFVSNYPFVGYQFTLMPNVLEQIRTHGYSGKHLSTGERSMLSTFKESAQAVERQEIGALVPFWRLFDTLERQLDHGIKQIFERARQAAERGQGLELTDVDVLKCLYLVVYLPRTQVPSTVANVATLMADAIDVDTMALKEQVQASLERLVRQNYVTRDGNRYTFLTDQEQDVEREIQSVQLDSADVLERIEGIVYDGIFTSTKLRKGANDFPVDRLVDDAVHGRSQNGMRLNVITAAHELSEATDAVLGLKSQGQALIVLAGSGDYYDLVQNAAKVKKYMGTVNREGLPNEKRQFVERKQRQANDDMKAARDVIESAIMAGRVAVDGQVVTIPATSAKGKLEAALERLATSVFTKAEYVDAPLNNGAQIGQALAGKTQIGLTPDSEPNARACEEMERYLVAQKRTHQSVSLGDLQRHFQQRPYGWRQDDVSLILATLIGRQRATATYAGEVVSARDPRLQALITKQSSFDKVGVRIRTGVSQHLVTGAKQLLRKVDRTAQIPSDEDGLVAAIALSLEGIRDRCDGLLARYRGGRPYPGERIVRDVRRAADSLLGGSRDPEAFLRTFNRDGEDLEEDLQEMVQVEGFFAQQKGIFDGAWDTTQSLKAERTYFEGDAATMDALSKMEQILSMPEPYGRIHELTDLRKQAERAYGAVVERKRADTQERIDAAVEDVVRYAESQKAKAGMEIVSIQSDARSYGASKRPYVKDESSCTKLDAMGSQAAAWSKQQMAKVDEAVRIEAQRKLKRVNVRTDVPVVPQKRTKVLSRSKVCPIRLLDNEAAVDEYVANIRKQLMDALNECGSVRLN